MQRLQALMKDAEVDMTLFFRGLADVDPRGPTLDAVADAFYDPQRRERMGADFEAWLGDWAVRVEADDAAARIARMHAANPLYVPRNYLAQQAIDAAHAGDLAELHGLMDVLRRPYEAQPGCERFAARRPDWARTKAGCSMLSCSS